MPVNIGSGRSTRRPGAGNPQTFLGSALVAWWTADRDDLLTVSGGVVTGWKDVVGGYDAADAAAGPTYSKTGFNGSPGLTFNGTTQSLTVASPPASLPNGSLPSEIWGILQQDAPSTGDNSARYAVSWGVATAGQRRGLSRASGNNLRSLSSNGTADVNAVWPGDSLGRHVVRAEQTTTEAAITVDKGDRVATACVLASTGLNRLRLGAFNGGTAANFWQGAMRDVLITTPLSNEQLSALWAWSLARVNP